MTNRGKHYNVGEGHPRRKLSWAQVREIRRQYVWRNMPAASQKMRWGQGGAMALGRQFGVGHSHICRIVRGEAWAGEC